MGKNTNIPWCDHTFNPWIGCTKVSPGCWKCYAEAQNKRWAGGENWGPGAPRRRTSEANWRQPLKWNREEDGVMVSHAEFVANRRPRVFCASLADWLDDEVPIEWLADLLDLINRTPNLDWLLLTKRPGNWEKRVWEVGDFAQLPDTARGAHTGPSFARRWYDNKQAPANIWIGTTVEDQKRAEERIPSLLKIPARVRFLSCEPLLEPVNLDFGHPRFRTAESYHSYIHWVICGGESGPGARPMLVEWADDLRRQCAASAVPFFMKQLGANVGTTNANAHDWPEHVEFHEVAGTPQFAGAKVILSDKMGGDIDDFPEELRIRQFPA